MTINPAKGQTDQWTEESTDVLQTDQKPVFNKCVQSILRGKQCDVRHLDFKPQVPHMHKATSIRHITLSKTVQTQLDVSVQRYMYDLIQIM